MKFDKKRQPLQKKLCENFEKESRFSKAGYFNYPKLRTVKQQLFEVKFDISLMIKERGNRFFKIGKKYLKINQTLGQYELAIKEYELSLSIFTYIEKVTYDNALEELQYVDYVGENENEKQQVQSLKLKLYMNLAACYIKLKFFSDAISACDRALEFDKAQIKIYYRRAQARIQQDFTNWKQLELALKDLEFAKNIDPLDKETIKEIARINQQIQKLKKGSKTIKKKITEEFKPKIVESNKEKVIEPNNPKVAEQSKPKFVEPNKTKNIESSKPKVVESNQENVYEIQIKIESNQGTKSSRSSSCSSDSSNNNENLSEKYTNFWKQFNIHKDYENFNYELSYEEDLSKPVPPEVHELGKFIKYKGVQMIQKYQIQGRRKEAEELQEKLKKAIAAKSQLEKISRLDFSKPKLHLKEVAERFGIDLLEESIQNEFKKIQVQNIIDIRNWLNQNQWEYQQEEIQQEKERKKEKEKEKEKVKEKEKEKEKVKEIEQQKEKEKEKEKEQQKEKEKEQQKEKEKEQEKQKWIPTQGNQGDQGEQQMKEEQVDVKEEEIKQEQQEGNKNYEVMECGQQGQMLEEEFDQSVIKDWKEVQYKLQLEKKYQLIRMAWGIGLGALLSLLPI